jgi:hypothetical protein
MGCAGVRQALRPALLASGNDGHRSQPLCYFSKNLVREDVGAASSREKEIIEILIAAASRSHKIYCYAHENPCPLK